MENNQEILVKHLSQPPSLRNEEWHHKAFELMVDANVTIENDDPKAGPDGMPYMLASIKIDSKEPCQKLCRWLYEKGIGLVVNPQKQDPDFVFSYGMIWSFLATNSFLPKTAASEEEKKDIEVTPGQQYYFGDLTDDIIPKTPRDLIKEFFKQSKIITPQVKLMSADQQSFDICFSRESLNGLTEKEEANLMEKLYWFMPRHYSLAIVTAKGLPEFLNL